jgi:hypothetical protein
MTAIFTERISEEFPIATSCNCLMGKIAAAIAGTLDVMSPAKPPCHERAYARARARQESNRHLNFPFPL